MTGVIVTPAAIAAAQGNDLEHAKPGTWSRVPDARVARLVEGALPHVLTALTDLAASPPELLAVPFGQNPSAAYWYTRWAAEVARNRLAP